MMVRLTGTVEGRSIDVREGDDEVMERVKAKEGGSAIMGTTILVDMWFEVFKSCPDHDQMFA